jgi:hypothetical protein
MIGSRVSAALSSDAAVVSGFARRRSALSVFEARSEAGPKEIGCATRQLFGV